MKKVSENGKKIGKCENFYRKKKKKEKEMRVIRWEVIH